MLAVAWWRGALNPAIRQLTQPRIPGLNERPDPRVATGGRLLIPLPEGLVVLPLGSTSPETLVPSGASASITHGRWSPNGRDALYAIFHVRAGDTAASSEIFLVEPGKEPRNVASRDRPGTALETPEWLPDGRSFVMGVTVLENQRLTKRVERVDLASGARAQIADGALPAVSPDGKQLLTVRADRQGEQLRSSPIEGGEPVQVVPPGQFSVLGQARFSPDGKRIALPASSPPPAAERRQSEQGPVAGLLLPSVAYAHGDPWDVFILDATGGEPRLLAKLQEDEVSLAWSPDGTRLAAFASRGVYLIGMDGSVNFILDRGGFGGIDWAP
ncbi:MAG: hypothetical protein U0821_04585 [Chloroflexota bacterium]